MLDSAKARSFTRGKRVKNKLTRARHKTKVAEGQREGGTTEKKKEVTRGGIRKKFPGGDSKRSTIEEMGAGVGKRKGPWGEEGKAGNSSKAGSPAEVGKRGGRACLYQAKEIKKHLHLQGKRRKEGKKNDGNSQLEEK